MTRLRRNKSGARFPLHSDDLLHVLWMPHSLQVRITRILISRTGYAERAEWIAGSKSSYKHDERQLDESAIQRIDAALASLAIRTRQFQDIDSTLDQSIYESTSRLFLRYWFEGQETGNTAYSSQYFQDGMVSQDMVDEYKIAFQGVVSLLPAGWRQAIADRW